jgi:hypothetical protein
VERCIKDFKPEILNCQKYVHYQVFFRYQMRKEKKYFLTNGVNKNHNTQMNQAMCQNLTPGDDEVGI